MKSIEQCAGLVAGTVVGVVVGTVAGVITRIQGEIFPLKKVEKIFSTFFATLCASVAVEVTVEEIGYSSSSKLLSKIETVQIIILGSAMLLLLIEEVLKVLSVILKLSKFPVLPISISAAGTAISTVLGIEIGLVPLVTAVVSAAFLGVLKEDQKTLTVEAAVVLGAAMVLAGYASVDPVGGITAGIVVGIITLLSGIKVIIFLKSSHTNTFCKK